MIEVSNVTKVFGTKKAVEDVSFKVAKGEVLGFLGPNGAGKSTTMRMITGYIMATSGKVRVGGIDVQENPVAARQLMGYLPESAPAYSDLSVSDFLHFAAEIRGLSGAEKGKAVDRAIEMCFLASVRHQSIDTLSKGYRHRTCFAQSILHDPDVLIMDEPTDGLDPNQKHEVRNLIRRMGETKAIVFSTHILEEVEAVCSKALIIDRGRVVANGTPSELKSRAENAGSLLVSVKEANPALRDSLRSIPGVESVEEVQAGMSFRLRSKKSRHDTSLEEAVAALTREKSLTLLKLAREEGRLDDVFRSLTIGEADRTAA